jgi:hypothetical protein
MAEKHSTKLIPLTQGQFAIVDAEDFDRLNQFKWFAHYQKDTRSFYAERNRPTSRGKRGTLPMTHVILNVTGMVDHKNHNTLDNRKENLRAATNSQNCTNGRTRLTNRSGHPGVCWHKRDKNWRVYIQRQGKWYHLGNFPTKTEAIRVRRKAEKRFYGEFAPSRSRK